MLEATAGRDAATSHEDRPGRPGAVVVLGVAAAYALVGWTALMLAGPPGYASPLFPSAGIALAAVLTWGRRTLPGVLLGSFLVNAGLGWLRDTGPGALVVLPLVIGVGAMLQAWAGSWLIRRFVGQPVVLNAPRDIVATGLLGAVVAGAVNPSIATAALVLAGAVPLAEAAQNWLTWWVGDALGVLIGAPLALTLIGRPRDDWRPRRRTLGLPLVIALVLLAGALAQLGRVDRERAELAFARDTDRLAGEVESRLRRPLYALEALHGAVRANDAADARTLQAASAWWLSQPWQLQALGYSERVAVEAIPGFEAAARAEGLAGFRVFQRDDGSALARDREAVVVRRVEPLQGNAAALGVNALSIPAGREAILAARDSGEPVATAAFRLTQAARDEQGAVVYRALYGGVPTTVEERRRTFRGVVFVSLRLDALLADLGRTLSPALQWCLIDPREAAARQRLGGAQGCEQRIPGAAEGSAAARAALRTQRTIAFAGRPLQLHAWSGEVNTPTGAQDGWLLSLGGLAGAAMLAALLLTVTGHSRRTELAVEAGTADLRREIGERRQVEEALRQSEARLRNILEFAPLGVVFLDPHGAILDANQRAFDLLARRPEATRGMRVADLVHADDRSALEREHRELLAGRIKVARRQLRLVRGDGRDHWVRVAASALRGEDGRVTRMIAMVEDLAEHIRLEEAERELHRAEAASRAKSEFVSRMSHELRTPLNAMIGFAQLLALDKDAPLPRRQADWAQQIQRAGWHLLELINETLDLARIESGAVRLALQPVQVMPMVEACWAMIASAAEQRGVRLESEGEPDLPAVQADPTRLRQVLTNLLSNAVKYNREQGRVHVVTRRVDAERVQIAVADSGLGMTATQMQHLFQPYNRLGRESSGIEGTGIGLVISRRLAELMDGSLEATSRADEGSVFTLTLRAAPAAGPSDVPPEPGAPQVYQQRRVHYVEDNETNVEVMRGVLAQRPQVALTVSSLGLDGLQAARQLRPDLMLLDMHLPDISGLELLRHLKTDVDVADIPVIVVSADATPGRMQEALTLGAAHYVTKPVDVARFLALVDDLLQGRETRWGL